MAQAVCAWGFEWRDPCGSAGESSGLPLFFLREHPREGQALSYHTAHDPQTANPADCATNSFMHLKAHGTEPVLWLPTIALLR